MGVGSRVDPSHENTIANPRITGVTRVAWDDGLDHGSNAYNIASSENGRIRVVAGPGTGKSFAMKRRVARLLEEGVDPASILPVTFTRVAAEDLHRELVGMATPLADQLKAITLHSLGLKILSRNHVLEVTERHPRPLNDFEMEPLYADLSGHGGKRDLKKKILAYHAAWARLQEDDPANVEEFRDADFEASLISWLRFHRGMLIGEVIPYLYGYLRDNPAADERHEFGHILVDEFQDLNKVEQQIIVFLSDQADVCIVGDDDQSIYSFKYAHPDGINEWCGANAGSEDLELIDCRRCPAKVVQIANHLISESPTRENDRSLSEFEQNGQGEVRIIQYQHLDDEVDGIADIVEQLMGAETHPGEIIVLAQRKKIGTYIYEALVARGVPAKSYYQEAELAALNTQEKFAFLKLTADRDDRVALRWLVGRNSGQWLRGGYERIRLRSEQTGLSPWAILGALAEGGVQIPHTGPVRDAFVEVSERVEELEQIFLEDGLVALIDELFPEGDDGWRDLRTLALETAEALELDQDEAGEPADLRKFVGELSYAIAQPEIPSQIQDVRVMSLHKSKGLSANATIIASCVEGVLPRAADDNQTQQERLADIEEQRRLLFVGVTRVKARPDLGQPGRLYITYSRRMLAADAHQSGIQPASFSYDQANLLPSRFLGDLGPSAPAREAG